MKILKVRDVKTPDRGTPGSAGLDFFIPNDQDTVVIRPGTSVLIPSGIKANIPEGFALIAFNKSGIAVKKQLLVGACVVDEDYQGEIHIDLKNVGKERVELQPGDKAIQLLCVPVEYVDIDVVSSESELYPDGDTDRGTGGFGSTGEQ